MYSYFNSARSTLSELGSHASSFAQHTSGMLQHGAPLLSAGMKAMGGVMGAVDLVQGAREVYTNSQAGGTWGGMLSGAVRAAGGAGQLALTMGTGGTYSSAAVAAHGLSSFSKSYFGAPPQSAGQGRFRQGNTVLSGVQAAAGLADVYSGGGSAFSSVAKHSKTLAGVSSKLETAGKVSMRVSHTLNN